MNTQHLSHIQSVLDTAVSENKMAGVNCLVYQNGKEQGYWESGFADIENKKPFSRDTICRLYSMSKPITGVAAMKLLEEGKITLMDEVADFIPSFKNMTCMKNGRVEKCARLLTIQDLLNMTSGISYGGDNDEAHQHISKLIYCPGGLDESAGGANNISTQDVARRISEGPLSFEPGTDYEYGMSADVMGAVIEIVSGMKFGEFLKKNIFDPLGMNDTGFFVPEEKQSRLAKVYQADWNAIVNVSADGKPCGEATTPKGAWGGVSKSAPSLKLYSDCHLGIQDNMKLDPAFESGGAGLCSTLDDYMKFVLMLTNEGTLDGKQILKPQTVRFMSEARLRPNLQNCFDIRMPHLSGYTYCNLNRVCIEPGRCHAITEKGEFGWDGWLGPYMSVDLKNKLSIVYMTQKTDAGTTCTTHRVKNIIYTSL